MPITDNKVVQFHYTLREGDELIETSAGGEPLAYLHGQSNIIPGLQKAMEGKASGDAFDVTIPAAEAYGERQDGHQQQVPIKHLQGAKRWQPGMTATVHTDHGVRQVTVIKAGLKHATIDLNHPLAGKDLTFSVEVVDVRDATDDEVSHGHAHGAGGHHH